MQDEENNSKYMDLIVMTPSSIILKEKIVKLVAYGKEGSFCLKPRHVDYISALVSSVVKYNIKDGNDGYISISNGILTKNGAIVKLTVMAGTCGSSLEEVSNSSIEKMQLAKESEQKAKNVISSLEKHMMSKIVNSL